MAAEWIEVILLVWKHGWRPTPDELRQQGLWPTDRFRCSANEQPGSTAKVYLAEAQSGAFTGAARWDQFHSALETGLENAANWLTEVGAEPFNSLREKGFNISVHVGAWIDQDQFDLDLPSSFLLASGRAGLRINVVTND